MMKKIAAIFQVFLMLQEGIPPKVGVLAAILFFFQKSPVLLEFPAHNFINTRNFEMILWNVIENNMFKRLTTFRLRALTFTEVI